MLNLEGHMKHIKCAKINCKWFEFVGGMSMRICFTTHTTILYLDIAFRATLYIKYFKSMCWQRFHIDSVKSNYNIDQCVQT